MKRMICSILASLSMVAVSSVSHAADLPPRQVEDLGRGVVAINQGQGKVFISWRLLGTEDAGIAFNLYRQSVSDAPIKLNNTPIANVTFFQDTTADLSKETSYFIRPVLRGAEGPPGAPFKFAAGAPVRPYLSIPIKNLPTGYSINDGSVGDLDGDGEYEIIVHLTGRSHDNSQAGPTDAPVFQAYKLDGTLLWTINLGKNIREGTHYTQFIVYDLDSDGKAEFACKTADGTTDSAGKVLGDANANWVSERGYILTGPEYLTVFDGLTGKEAFTTDYHPPRGTVQAWGDNYGNRVDRFNATVAYLDGVHPSLIMCRGYYTRTVLAAYDYRDKKLTSRWIFDTDDPNHPEHRPYRGQGNHGVSVADVDADGKDEIVFGAMCVDDDGKGLWNTRLGHGDAMHVSDLDPTRPGLEEFDIQERFSDAGAHFNDARTGETLWKKPSVAAGADGEGPGRGLAVDIDPRHPGAECWVAGAGIRGLFSCKGELISQTVPRSCNFAIQWDGDTLYELLDRNRIDKWDYEQGTERNILTAEGCTSNNGTKATPVLSGDIFGDWREEVIWRTTDNRELRIYTTTIPTTTRMYTLMHDTHYRVSIAWQNSAYNQPPHKLLHGRWDEIAPKAEYRSRKAARKTLMP